MGNINSERRKDNGNNPTLPKITVEDRVKSALLRLLKIPEKGLERAKIDIQRDGKKILVIIKTDIGKLKNDIFHLLHHPHLKQDRINANTNTRDFTIEVPEELHPDVTKLTDSGLDINERLEHVEQKLKELNSNKS